MYAAMAPQSAAAETSLLASHSAAWQVSTRNAPMLGGVEDRGPFGGVVVGEQAPGRGADHRPVLNLKMSGDEFVDRPP
jgi:hypothetical protein